MIELTMLSNKHTVDEFQKEMWRVRDKHWDEIQKYGDDLEVVLSDIDPSFDWFELEDDGEYLTI